MRRYLFLLVAGLLVGGLSCNFPPESTPGPAEPHVVSSVPPAVTATSPPEGAAICVWAYEDSNANAMHDKDEPPLAKVLFSVLLGEIEIEAHVTGAELEPYCFSDLLPGSYVVHSAPPNGFEGTNPTTLSLALTPGARLPVVLGFERVPPLRDGRVRLAEAIVGHIPGSETLLLAMEGKLQRSDDGGQNWRAMGERAPASRVVASMAAPNLLLAADGFPCLRGGPAAPLFISRDGGGNWEEVEEGVNLLPTAAHPWDPAVAWAVGCDGAYRTDDGGQTWQLQPAPDWGLYLLETIVPVASQPEVLYAAGNSEGGSGAFFRSDDGGRTWRLLTDEPTLWIAAILVHPGDPREVWFATPTGVWHSEDGGGSWTRSAAGLQAVAVGDDWEFEGRGLHSLARTQSGVLFLGTERGAFQSGDGGASWIPLTGTPWDQESVSHVVASDAWPSTRLWVVVQSGVYIYSPPFP